MKQLTSFCGMLFERYEDEVIAALVSDALVRRGECHTSGICTAMMTMMRSATRSQGPMTNDQCCCVFMLSITSKATWYIQCSLAM